MQASNAAGSGPASAASNAVTPTNSTAPDAPTGVAAIPATGQALVSWTAPAANGSPITSYTVTPYIGTTAQTPVQVNDGSATTVDGERPDQRYRVHVQGHGDQRHRHESRVAQRPRRSTPDDTIFDFATPAVVDSSDGGSVNLGVKFTADTSGQVVGIRFYKASTNTGTHIGTLWSANGTQLATATFTNETGSGWQTVLFSNPVSITAGTTYVASYFDPNGHYSLTSGGFSAAVDNPPLHAVANGTSANGLYNYGSTSCFPDQYVQRRQLLGGRAVPADSARAGHQRNGDGGIAIGHRQLDGTGQWRGHELHGYAVHWHDRADADDDHRQSARQQHHCDRAAERHRVHVQGHSGQCSGLRSGLGAHRIR